MDMTAFLKRMDWKQWQLAEKVGVGTSTVGSWCCNRIYPAYDKVAILLELGMTIEELFGPDIAAKVVVTKNALQERQAAYNTRLDFNDPEVKAAMAQALSDILAKSTANKP